VLKREKRIESCTKEKMSYDFYELKSGKRKKNLHYTFYGAELQ